MLTDSRNSLAGWQVAQGLIRDTGIRGNDCHHLSGPGSGNHSYIFVYEDHIGGTTRAKENASHLNGVWVCEVNPEPLNVLIAYHHRAQVSLLRWGAPRSIVVKELSRIKASSLPCKSKTLALTSSPLEVFWIERRVQSAICTMGTFSFFVTMIPLLPRVTKIASFGIGSLGRCTLNLINPPKGDQYASGPVGSHPVWGRGSLAG